MDTKVKPKQQKPGWSPIWSELLQYYYNSQIMIYCGSTHESWVMLCLSDLLKLDRSSLCHLQRNEVVSAWIGYFLLENSRTKLHCIEDFYIILKILYNFVTDVFHQKHLKKLDVRGNHITYIRNDFNYRNMFNILLLTCLFIHWTKSFFLFKNYLEFC